MFYSRYCFYLPGIGHPGEWLDDGFRLRDLNTVTMGDLPARLDWSIIGWTILLLAFINLENTQNKLDQWQIFGDILYKVLRTTHCNQLQNVFISLITVC